MKYIEINEEEWYPVLEFKDTLACRRHATEISDEKLAQFNSVIKLFDALQDELEKLYNKKCEELYRVKT